MKEHKKHKGGGMPYFEREHWQKNVEDVVVADTKYSGGEMNQCEEYKKMVDAQANYVKKHRAMH